MMIKQWHTLLLGTLFVISACHAPVYHRTEADIARTRATIQWAKQHAHDQYKTPPALIVKPGMYVDTTPIDLRKSPAWLKNPIVIRGDSLPFSYYSRTITSGAGNNFLTTYQLGLDTKVGVSMNYAGTIRGALDVLASKTGYVYSIHNNKIYWLAFITKTFDVAFMPGSTDYTLGKSGSSGGSGGGGGGAGGAQTLDFADADSAQSSSITGKLSIWTDLEKTIHSLLSPVGRVDISESTTSVTVRDHPTNVELIGQYIRNLNANLSKQVLVKIQVLELDLDDDFSYGINWGLIFRAFAGSQYQLKGQYGTPFTISPITFAGLQAAIVGVQSQDQNPPSYQILINSLEQQGRVSVVTEPRVVCLNNQVSVIRIINRQSYAASIQNTSGVGSSGSVAQNTVTSQITPGVVATGLSLYLLPKILSDKIYLQISADLSTNPTISTFPANAPAGSPQIQLPNVNQKTFNQKSVIHSGDTLILSGFKQVKSQVVEAQLFKSRTLGTKGSALTNTETIILITPIIMPGGVV